MNMLRQSSFTSSTTPPEPKIHLRQACDGCSVAKVKCDKTHPTCGRCQTNKQPCKYSDSRRNGKRARLARPGQHSSAAPTVPTSAVLLPVIPPLEQPPWDTPEHSARTVIASPMLPYFGSNLDQNDAWMYTDFAFPLDFGNGSQSSNSPWTTPSSLLGSDPSPLSFDHASRVMQEHRAAATASESVVRELRSEDGHDCEALAMNTLHSLRSTLEKSDNDSEQDVDTTFGKCARSSGLRTRSTIRLKPTIDILLLTNKIALSKLTDILQCTCARRPHILLLLTAIMAKVLYWYRIGATASQGSPFVRVKTMKIQFGILELDDEDQARLQRAVLKRELRKMEHVLDLFAKIPHCDVSLNDDCEGTGRSLHWQGMVTSKFREGLEKVMQETNLDHR